MRKAIKDVLHKLLLSIKVVEAKKGQILINSEKHLTMNRINGLISHQSNVAGERQVNAFSNVHVLEERIVFFLLGEVAEDVVVLEHPVFNQHQGFNILQVDSFFEGAGQVKQILENT